MRRVSINTCEICLQKKQKNSSNAIHSQSKTLAGTKLRENRSKSFEHSPNDATSTYVFKRTAFLEKFRRGRNVDDEISNKDMRSTPKCENSTSGRRRPLVSLSVLKFPIIKLRDLFICLINKKTFLYWWCSIWLNEFNWFRLTVC